MNRHSPEGAKVLDLELGRRIDAVEGYAEYEAVWALVHIHGAPVGAAVIPLRDGRASAETIRSAIEAGLPDLADRREEWVAPSGPAPASWPPLTVAVCTRDRPDDLRRCLEGLAGVEYEDVQILVVDNAPSDDAARRVCAEWPDVTYVMEPRPGLNWARNRAVLEASGEILAFTDDDALVDRAWPRSLVLPFLQEPSVMAVAGLVTPLELETAAQVAFEGHGGLSGGFEAIEMQGEPEWGARGFWHYVLVAQHGSGANMAFRRSVFSRVGLFDTALDVGTPSNGGGDQEMLFRIMAEGFRFRYEPTALVRHRHRRSFDDVERQIEGWGSGVFAFLTRSALAYPRAGWVMALLGIRGLALHLRRLVSGSGGSRRLALAELRGSLAGPARYFRGRRNAAATERAFGPQPTVRYDA